MIDLVFPPACMACGELVEGSPLRRLCAACAGELERAELPAAVRLAGPARELVRALKYRGLRHVVTDIETVVRDSAALVAHLRGAVLVPVPLHPRRERERGFNQSRLIARAMARAAGAGTVVRDLLVRRIDTAPQVGVGWDARLANVKNAFALAPGALLNRGLRHLIIDDVVTTGSTLESCAHVLREAGCLKVDVAAFGRG